MSRNLRVSVLILLLATATVAACYSSAVADVPVIDDQERAALREVAAADAARLARLLSDAYGLDEAASVAFEAECLSRVNAEVEAQADLRAAALVASERWQEAIKKHGEDWVPSSAEIEELQRPVTQVANQLPLSIQSLQAILERNLSPESTVAARERFTRLQAEDNRRVAIENREKGEIDLGEKIAIHIKVEDQRRAAAELSPAGNPLPKEQPPPPPPIVTPPPPKPAPEPARPVEHHVTPPQPPVQPPPRPVEPPPPPPPPLAPAPPIDEWDRHVDAVAARYRFTSEQKGKAQGVLKDLRDRARQYRKSRSAEYEAVARMQAGAEKLAEEKRLNEPLDELFAELKERLENLPTQEQRDAAGGTPKK